MVVNQIIIYVMVLFMAIAAVDRIIGSPLGLGDKMDQGVAAIGPLCIPMVGMIVLAPLVGRTIGPIVTPLFHFLGADPAMAATSLLACDMGGYSLAYAIADTEEGAQFAGCILGTLLGSIITFMIPVGMTFVKKENRDFYMLGIMIGIMSVPAGLFAGGLTAGYSLSMVAHNSLPILLFSALVTVGLLKAQALCIKIFNILGYIVVGLSTLGFALGIVQEVTPLVLIEDLPSVLDGIKIVGGIAIILCGAFPMIDVLSRFCAGFLKKVGHLLHIDEVAVMAMLSCTANVMPLLKTCNQMSPAGIVVSLAFCVGANSMLGDFLGFVAGVDRTMIVPMLVANIVSAIVSLPVAIWVSRKKNLQSTCQIDQRKKYKVKRGVTGSDRT
ncbi:MAG: ethanolamine utilization protein EutH [Emergencia sp.]|nr:ethanolamine utilization protein EutH [Emergencia sp.]